MNYHEGETTFFYRLFRQQYNILLSLQNDGSHIQTQIRYQTCALLEQNWVHSSPKYGLRFDGQPPKVGYRGTMQSNAAWCENFVA